jgi:predicted RNase H-like HicB family nuclease
MNDKEIKKISLYKFYVNGEEMRFKNPIAVDVIQDKDYLIFSVEEGDLMIHIVANTIDEGLEDIKEILEIEWKDYVLEELGSLTDGAKEYGKYLKSLVEGEKEEK